MTFSRTHENTDGLDEIMAHKSSSGWMLYYAHRFPNQQELWAPPCCGLQVKG